MRQSATRIDTLAAAYLAGQGKNQSDIAAALGVSQTTVSRMLKNTKDKYWRERVQFIRKEVDEATMQNVLQRIGGNRLADTLRATVLRRTEGRRRGPILRVFSGGRKNAKIEERMDELARNAAPYVHGIFLRAGTCGLTWGGMLWRLINALRALQIKAPWVKRVRLDCIPLTGEPLGSIPTSFLVIESGG